MHRHFISLFAVTLILCGCASRRTAVTEPVVLPAENSTAVQPAKVLYPVGRKPAAQRPPAEAPVQPEVAALPAALLIDPSGLVHTLAGCYKGSDPSQQISFTDAETRDVKIVNIAPRTGEMLIVDLTRLGGQFRYPGTGKVISNYGMRNGSMHTGVDIKAIPKDTLRAAFAGVVRMSKVYSGYGNIVLIRHDNGMETLYGHNTRNLVDVNQRVEAGQPIALAGRTGRATTEHLHFEVRVGGMPVDPSLLVDHDARCLKYDTLFLYNKGGSLLALNISSAAPYLTGSKTGMPENLAAAAREYCGTGSQALAIAPAEHYIPDTTKPAATSAAGKDISYQYHTVAKGDTISAISRRYGVSVKYICDMNGLQNPDRLSIGQRLKIKTL